MFNHGFTLYWPYTIMFCDSEQTVGGMGFITSLDT